MRASNRIGNSAGSVVILLVSCIIPFAGCSGTKAGPATVEVTGTVTLNGSPVEQASVLFSPEIGSNDGRLASQAKTDPQGRFQLTTHIGGGKFKSGIVPGKYVVTITKPDPAPAKNTFAAPKNLLPSKYADAKSSPFKAEVAAGQKNDFPFDLKNE
jgi:ABC-type transport system substrate-binding protein